MGILTLPEARAVMPVGVGVPQRVERIDIAGQRGRRLKPLGVVGDLVVTKAHAQVGGDMGQHKHPNEERHLRCARNGAFRGRLRRQEGAEYMLQKLLLESLLCRVVYDLPHIRPAQCA